jgi:hypothetical protein
MPARCGKFCERLTDFAKAAMVFGKNGQPEWRQSGAVPAPEQETGWVS